MAAVETMNAPLATDMDSIEWEPMLTSPESSLDDSQILKELTMLSKKMDVPQGSATTSSAIHAHSVSALKRKCLPDSLSCTPNAKRQYLGKLEPMYAATEPVTPSAQSKAPSIESSSPVKMPLSPASQSACSEEDDEPLSTVPASPLPTDFAVFPTPSRDQAAKRRAMRLALMKRSRTKKEEGVVGLRGGSRSVSDVAKSESDPVSAEPLDKKAARAIRNREAAMKSRVEAKQKMRKLEEDNNELTDKVKTLSAENEALSAQLKSLLSHTFGAQVVEGHDVKDILSAISQINGNNVMAATM